MAGNGDKAPDRAEIIPGDAAISPDLGNRAGDTKEALKALEPFTQRVLDTGEPVVADYKGQKVTIGPDHLDLKPKDLLADLDRQISEAALTRRGIPPDFAAKALAAPSDPDGSALVGGEPASGRSAKVLETPEARANREALFGRLEQAAGGRFADILQPALELKDPAEIKTFVEGYVGANDKGQLDMLKHSLKPENTKHMDGTTRAIWQGAIKAIESGESRRTVNIDVSTPRLAQETGALLPELESKAGARFADVLQPALELKDRAQVESFLRDYLKDGDVATKLELLKYGLEPENSAHMDADTRKLWQGILDKRSQEVAHSTAPERGGRGPGRGGRASALAAAALPILGGLGLANQDY